MPSDLKTTLTDAIARAHQNSSDFDLNPDVVLPEGRRLRPASVLILVDASQPRARLLLTKRSSVLKHHPGQIAFPGGKQDESDPDVVACALREAREEVGLPAECVEVLGTLPQHETVTGFAVTPVLAQATSDFKMVLETGEVEEAFWVPFSSVSQVSQFQIQARRWQGRYRRYYAVPHGPYYIWGATARILRGLAESLT